MNSSKLFIAYGVALVLSAMRSSAATIQFNSTSEITSIQGVEINGQAYNVYFDGSAGKSIFFGDYEGAKVALSSLDEIFFTEGTLNGIPYRLANGTGSSFEITYAIDVNGTSHRFLGLQVNEGAWDYTRTAGGSGAIGSSEALFQAVPESDAVGLAIASTGLLAFGRSRRRA